MAHKSRCDLAAVLLLIAAARHFGWEWFPPEMRGSVSKALGAGAILCLVWVAMALQRKELRSRELWAVALWWTFEELQVVVCSTAYAVKPWAVPVGQSICSARIDFDIGAVSLMLVAWAAWRLRSLTVRPVSGGKQRGTDNDG